MTSFYSHSQSVVKIQPALEQRPRPALTTDPVEKSIESFAKDSDSNIVNQEIKAYLTEAYQIIKQAENNQSYSPSYSYACYKQAIIIMLSITKGINKENSVEFSVQDEPSHLFGKLLDHYSSEDTQSKDICMEVFHVARDMIENNNSDAKSACTNYRCMARGCSNDETIRNEILKKFLKEDKEDLILDSEARQLNETLKLLFNEGLGCVLNDSPPPPPPHPELRSVRVKRKRQAESSAAQTESVDAIPTEQLAESSAAQAGCCVIS